MRKYDKREETAYGASIGDVINKDFSFLKIHNDKKSLIIIVASKNNARTCCECSRRE